MTKNKSEIQWEDLQKDVGSIQRQLRRQNALTQVFLRGILSGLGATLGATLVLALVVFVITRITQLFGVEALVQPFLPPVQ